MDLKLKNEVRAFELKQFRNIGYGDKSEDYSTLILNYSLNPEYMGDLVILIGPNNSGKSNVLDALSIFANRKITKRDASDTRLSDENPTLKLFASSKNDKSNAIIYEYQLNKNNKLQFKERTKIENEPIFNLNEYIDNFTADSKIMLNDFIQVEKLIKKYKLNIS
ncbi:AAA family ATPase [bacterium]|nr:AAA family ATPase [bacterium]